jgi:hypothetical protein
MIIKIYWIARVFGYIASLAGIFLFLYNQADADPAARNLGLALVGTGFIGFFVSYAARAWLRFGPGHPPNETRTR